MIFRILSICLRLILWNAFVVLLILIIRIPVALLLALLGSYFLAGRALSPVAVVFDDTLGRLGNSFEQLRRFTTDTSHELRKPFYFSLSLLPPTPHT
jgi:hypothetical protein